MVRLIWVGWGPIFSLVPLFQDGGHGLALVLTRALDGKFHTYSTNRRSIYENI